MRARFDLGHDAQVESAPVRAAGVARDGEIDEISERWGLDRRPGGRVARPGLSVFHHLLSAADK